MEFEGGRISLRAPFPPVRRLGRRQIDGKDTTGKRAASNFPVIEHPSEKAGKMFYSEEMGIIYRYMAAEL